MTKKRYRTCEIDQSRSASSTQPHASSQPTHFAGASPPHQLPKTSQPPKSHNSSDHACSQPHEAEEDLNVQDHADDEELAARIRGMTKKRYRTWETDQSRNASPSAQPHASSQPTHFARASPPHQLLETSQPPKSHSSSHPVRSHGYSQPHEAEDLNVQDDANDEEFSARIKEMARRRWHSWYKEKNLNIPPQLHYISHPTPSCGASQGAQPHTPSQVHLPHESVQPMQSNASSRCNISRNSSQPQNAGDNRELDYCSDDDQFPECEVAIADESSGRKKRGITRLADIWNLPPTKRIVVEFNQVFLPVGKEGGLYSRFLGTIARKPHLCPINYKSWHEVPQHYKDDCWNIIQSKFVIPENNRVREGIKHKTLKSLAVKLRDWRWALKNKYFDEAKTPAQIVAQAPPTVNREHYANLVSYWFSKEGKALSLKNKEDRDWTENKHTAGSKSFAQHAHEMEAKSGFAPSRAMLYKPTHTRADGTAISEVASANIEKMQDLLKSQPNSLEGNSKGSIYWSQNDIYSQVITKKERHGRRRGCGFGYTSKINNSTFNDPLSFNVVDEEERMRDKETISKLEETVQAQAGEMQAQAREMQAQAREMSTLKEQVALLMRLMPGVTGLQVRDGCNDPPDQASPRTHQRSSHASHDFECSPRGNRTI